MLSLLSQNVGKKNILEYELPLQKSLYIEKSR